MSENSHKSSSTFLMHTSTYSETKMITSILGAVSMLRRFPVTSACVNEKAEHVECRENTVYRFGFCRGEGRGTARVVHVKFGDR